MVTTGLCATMWKVDAAGMSPRAYRRRLCVIHARRHVPSPGNQRFRGVGVVKNHAPRWTGTGGPACTGDTCRTGGPAGTRRRGVLAQPGPEVVDAQRAHAVVVAHRPPVTGPTAAETPAGELRAQLLQLTSHPMGDLLDMHSPPNLPRTVTAFRCRGFRRSTRTRTSKSQRTGHARALLVPSLRPTFPRSNGAGILLIDSLAPLTQRRTRVRWVTTTHPSTATAASTVIRFVCSPRSIQDHRRVSRG